jgi:pentapeptide MXKDX repeat protein
MRRTIILTATVACLSIGFSGAVFAQDRGSDRDTSRMDRMDRGGMDRGGMDRGGMDRDGMDRFHRDHGSYSDGDGRGRYADRRDDDGSDEHDRMVRMHERMMERMGSMGGGGGMGGGRDGSMRGGFGGPRQNPGFVFRSGDMQIVVRCGAGETMKSCVDATTTLMDRAKAASTPGGAPGTSSPAPSTAP